ncbi:hypothetical protein DTO271G3_7456 [Paecilomyces variotii]|nr:hypothetical protein DTO271G3_7456 [Paecilomyces variotii]
MFRARRVTLAANAQATTAHHSRTLVARPLDHVLRKQNVRGTASAATASIPTNVTNPHTTDVAAPSHLGLPPAVDESFIGMTGGQIFHEMMRRHNVKHIFGYPGGTILPVFDAIYNSKYFEFILPKHEQGAGHMAEGYARASGKPGVVLVTSGPGATNVITPIQNALCDGTPLIVFCG